MKAYQVAYRVGLGSTVLTDVVGANSLDEAVAAIQTSGAMIVVESCCPIEYRVVVAKTGAATVYRDRLEAQGYMRSLVSQNIAFSFSAERA